MCGIFGWSFEKRPDAAAMGALAAMLARSNEERGRHSWGYAVGSGEREMWRGVGPLSANVPATKLATAKTLLAHTRYRTQGDVRVENAHPFRHGHILGAHNGMIYNAWQLDDAYARAFEVDSMHIFEHMRHGLPFEELEGYGAIEWFDARDPGAVFVCRMVEGELAIARTAFGCVWSSDRDHLREALFVAGIFVHHWYKVKTGTVYRMEAGVLRATTERVRITKSSGDTRRWNDGLDDGAASADASHRIAGWAIGDAETLDDSRGVADDYDCEDDVQDAFEYMRQAAVQEARRPKAAPKKSGRRVFTWRNGGLVEVDA